MPPAVGNHTAPTQKTGCGIKFHRWCNCSGCFVSAVKPNRYKTDDPERIFFGPVFFDAFAGNPYSFFQGAGLMPRNWFHSQLPVLYHVRADGHTPVLDCVNSTGRVSRVSRVSRASEGDSRHGTHGVPLREHDTSRQKPTVPQSFLNHPLKLTQSFSSRAARGGGIQVNSGGKTPPNFYQTFRPDMGYQTLPKYPNVPKGLFAVNCALMLQ